MAEADEEHTGENIRTQKSEEEPAVILPERAGLSPPPKREHRYQQMQAGVELEVADSFVLPLGPRPHGVEECQEDQADGVEEGGASGRPAPLFRKQREGDSKWEGQASDHRETGPVRIG